MPELSRRSLVRASAGALWVAPVITVATTAPALAVSGGVTVVPGSSVVSYVGYPAQGRQLDKLAVYITLENPGLPTGAVTIQALFSKKYGPVAALSGGAPLPGSGVETDDGWLVTFPGFVLSTTSGYAWAGAVQLMEMMESPYRGLRGSGGDVQIIVHVDDLTYVEPPVEVEPFSGPVGFEENATAYTSFPFDPPGVVLAAENLYGAGYHGIGQITMRIHLPKAVGTGEDRVETTSRPELGPITPSGTWQVSEYDTPNSESDEWVYEFVTTSEGFAGTHRDPPTTQEERGPGNFRAEVLGLPEGFTGFQARFVFDAEGFLGAELPEPINPGGT